MDFVINGKIKWQLLTNYHVWFKVQQTNIKHSGNGINV